MNLSDTFMVDFHLLNFYLSVFSVARLWELHPGGAAVQQDPFVHVWQRSLQSRLCLHQQGSQARGAIAVRRGSRSQLGCGRQRNEVQMCLVGKP